MEQPPVVSFSCRSSHRLLTGNTFSKLTHTVGWVQNVWLAVASIGGTIYIQLLLKSLTEVFDLSWSSCYVVASSGQFTANTSFLGTWWWCFMELDLRPSPISGVSCSSESAIYGNLYSAVIIKVLSIVPFSRDIVFVVSCSSSSKNKLMDASMPNQRHRPTILKQPQKGTLGSDFTRYEVVSACVLTRRHQLPERSRCT